MDVAKELQQVLPSKFSAQQLKDALAVFSQDHACLSCWMLCLEEWLSRSDMAKCKAVCKACKCDEYEGSTCEVWAALHM